VYCSEKRQPEVEGAGGVGSPPVPGVIGKKSVGGVCGKAVPTSVDAVSLFVCKMGASVIDGGVPV